MVELGSQRPPDLGRTGCAQAARKETPMWVPVTVAGVVAAMVGPLVSLAFVVLPMSLFCM